MAIPVPKPARSGAAKACTREPDLVAWEARRSLGPASPVNMSKRGLSLRLYPSNQTLIRVKTRLPKENFAPGNAGRSSPYSQREIRVPRRGTQNRQLPDQ